MRGWFQLSRGCALVIKKAIRLSNGFYNIKFYLPFKLLIALSVLHINSPYYWLWYRMVHLV